MKTQELEECEKGINATKEEKLWQEYKAVAEYLPVS
tara:strand:- start:4090 stop:4197 length:108 start_codon:yes stop_codon:yes gene_type:complete